MPAIPTRPDGAVARGRPTADNTTARARRRGQRAYNRAWANGRHTRFKCSRRGVSTKRVQDGGNMPAECKGKQQWARGEGGGRAIGSARWGSLRPMASEAERLGEREVGAGQQMMHRRGSPLDPSPVPTPKIDEHQPHVVPRREADHRVSTGQSLGSDRDLAEASASEGDGGAGKEAKAVADAEVLRLGHALMDREIGEPEVHDVDPGPAVRFVAWTPNRRLLVPARVGSPHAVIIRGEGPRRQSITARSTWPPPLPG